RPDIELPQLLHALVVVGDERSVAEPREYEPAGGAERRAEVRIRRAHAFLDLAGEWIGDDDLGFGRREELDPAVQQAAGRAPGRLGRQRDLVAGRARWNVDEPGLRTVRRRPVVAAAFMRRTDALGAVRHGLRLHT